ncbi:MAG: hypothetical protein ACO1TE_00935 [Prosthecobacter sp.]
MCRILILLSLLLLTPCPAAVIYSGVQNVVIPVSFDGVYLNVITGATSTAEPGTWASAPWLNPFFGGTQIASNDQLRPGVLTGSQIENLGQGTLVGVLGDYAPDYNGSTTHVGLAAEQFQLGNEGYIGYRFELTPGGPTHYGWLRLTLNNTGAGTIHDWAYDDSAGTAISAGWDGTAFVTPTPEPGRSTLVFVGLTMLCHRRRRCALFTPQCETKNQPMSCFLSYSTSQPCE